MSGFGVQSPPRILRYQGRSSRQTAASAILLSILSTDPCSQCSILSSKDRRIEVMQANGEPAFSPSPTLNSDGRSLSCRTNKALQVFQSHCRILHQCREADISNTKELPVFLFDHVRTWTMQCDWSPSSSQTPCFALSLAGPLTGEPNSMCPLPLE